MGAKKNIKLKEACEKLEYISEDEKMRRLSELRQKFILDENNRNRVLAEIENRLKEEQNELSEKQNELRKKEKNIDEEKKKLKEEKKEIVRGLLEMKIPIEKITEFTKLTKEEILEIKEDI